MNKIYFFILSPFFLLSSLSGEVGCSNQPDSQVVCEKESAEPLPIFCEGELNIRDSCDEAWDIWIYPSYFYLGYTGGKGIGYRRGYGTIGAFFTPTYFAATNTQPFIDIKGYGFSNGRWGSSAGLGVRQILRDSCIVLGYNLYYDYRNIHHFDFHQIGVGFELLGPLWDFRVNGYIPVGKTVSEKGRLFDFSGNYFAVRKKRISAWYGVDAEIGVWLKRKYACDWFGIYAAVGPYYYHREHHFQHQRHGHAFGGRARLLARICDFVDLSVIGTYDPVWHTRVQGQITVTIPFDCCGKIFNQCAEKCCCQPSPCLLNQIAIQPVQRNGIIVADQECCWLWNWSGGSGSCSGPTSHSVSLSRFNFSDDCGCSSSKSFDGSSNFFDYSY